MLQAWAYLTHVNGFYWELNWKLQTEFTSPQNLVAHDLIQHIMVNGLRQPEVPFFPFRYIYIWCAFCSSWLFMYYIIIRTVNESIKAIRSHQKNRSKTLNLIHFQMEGRLRHARGPALFVPLHKILFYPPYQN